MALLHCGRTALFFFCAMAAVDDMIHTTLVRVRALGSAVHSRLALFPFGR